MRKRVAIPLFVLLAVVHTWPMLPQAASHILDPVDSLLTSWLLAAVSRALVTHPLSFFDVNAYYPYRQVLGTLDHQLSAVIFAGPVYLASGNPLLALNLYTIATFAVSGVFCALLVVELTGSEPAGLIAGSLFAFSGARFENINHAHVLGNCWLPLVLLLLHRYTRQPTWRRLAGATAAALLLALSAWYNAVIGPLAIAVVGAADLVRYRAAARTALGRAAVAGVAAGILLAAVAWPYARVTREFRPSVHHASDPQGAVLGGPPPLERTISSSVIQDNSASLEGFAGVAGANRAPWLARLRGTGLAGTRFFPGVAGALLAGFAILLILREQSRASRLAWPALVLAALFSIAVLSVALGHPTGLPIALTRLNGCFAALVAAFAVWIFLPIQPADSRGWVREARTYLVLAIIGGALALGVRVYASGTVLAHGIYPAQLPPFNLLRASARFGVLYVLSVAVLAGYGYTALTRGLRGRSATIIAAVALLAVNIELLCAPLAMQRVPRLPHVYAWLRTAPPGAVVEFPIHDNVWILYWSLFHRRPVVNGYGLVEPQTYARVRDDDDLSPAMVDHIRAYLHPRYVIVNHAMYLGAAEATLAGNLARDGETLTRVAAMGGRDVFEIRGPSRGAPVLRAYRPWMLDKAHGVSVEADLETARARTEPVIQVWGNGQLLASASADRAARGDRIFAPLPADRSRGIDIEIMGDYRLTSPGDPIGRTGHAAPAEIAVTAQLRATRIQVNGHVWAGRQGYTLAVIAPDGRVEEVRVFNTSWYESASHALAERIRAIPQGWTAAVATNYDASRALTSDAVDALHTLGIAADLRGRFGWMHVAVGIKGAAVGTAAEDVSSTDARCVVGAPMLLPVVVRDVRLY